MLLCFIYHFISLMKFLLSFVISHRYKNYYLLCELIERLRCSRNSFFMHHKVERLNLKISDLKTRLSDTDVSAILQKVVCSVPPVIHIPDDSEDTGDGDVDRQVSGRSSKDKDDDREVELVTMGHYSLRKLMNFKLCRVEV